jgi:hypothetical protein
MSNIFIEDIVGQNDFAVPATDAALGTATTELDSLLSGVANLSYDRVLAWVETTSGAGASRTLNCVVEKFEYSGEECPDATETQTMTGAIETTLEADADITSIGSQQVHILTAGPYFSWERDAAGGFLYPAITTDDVVVGGDAAPQGKWFQDGDMVLGAAAMSGTEKLRVVGSERLEGFALLTEFAAVPLAPAAGEGTFWVRDDAPNTPMFTDDAGTDHELAISANVTSLQDVDHVIFVDKTSSVYAADGTMQLPYNTIGAAVTAANALSPSASNRIAIVIYSGIYAEAVVTQDDYVTFIGYDRDSTIIAPTTVNSPVSPGHVNVEFQNLTFETPAGNTDYIVDDATITQGDVTFRNCKFLATNGSANNYVRNRFKTLWLYSCDFEQTDTTQWVIYPSGSTVRNMYLFNCQVAGTLHVQGSCSVYGWGSRFTSTASSAAWYGTLRLNASAPKHYFYGCEFKSASSYDIEGNAQTIAVYGCPMSKGMSQWVRTRNQVKYCNGSAGDKDYHTTINDLVFSLQSIDDGAIIHFLGNYTSSAQVDQNDNIDIMIDGHGYTWTDTTPTSGNTLGNVGGGRMLVRNLNFIDATVYCQGSGTHLIIDNCYIEGIVYQRGVGDDATTRTVIHDSTVIGISGSSVDSPLSINSALPTIIVSKSYLKGYTGAHAVNYNGRDNDNVKFEYSKVFHGDLGTNNPFTGVGAFVINYKAHHTTFNQEPALAAPASYVNDIDSGQRHNTIDPDGDFDVMDSPW